MTVICLSYVCDDTRRILFLFRTISPKGCKRSVITFYVYHVVWEDRPDGMSGNVDGLSVHRLTLLGRVHVARVVVDSLDGALSVDVTARERQQRGTRGKPPTPTRAVHKNKRWYNVIDMSLSQVINTGHTLDTTDHLLDWYLAREVHRSGSCSLICACHHPWMKRPHVLCHLGCNLWSCERAALRCGIHDTICALILFRDFGAI